MCLIGLFQSWRVLVIPVAFPSDDPLSDGPARTTIPKGHDPNTGGGRRVATQPRYSFPVRLRRGAHDRRQLTRPVRPSAVGAARRRQLCGPCGDRAVSVLRPEGRGRPRHRRRRQPLHRLGDGTRPAVAGTRPARAGPGRHPAESQRGTDVRHPDGGRGRPRGVRRPPRPERREDPVRQLGHRSHDLRRPTRAGVHRSEQDRRHAGRLPRRTGIDAGRGRRRGSETVFRGNSTVLRRPHPSGAVQRRGRDPRPSSPNRFWATTASSTPKRATTSSSEKSPRNTAPCSSSTK